MGDFISQEEIDALLRASGVQHDITPTELSISEIDAIGEIGNISMGTSATTLSQVLGRKVIITTPEVIILTMEELLNIYVNDYVAVKIGYTKGLKGNSFMMLKENDCKAITDLMMGGDGTNVDGELTELHLSAISEAMNQMIGSSATSMSQMLGSAIDISPPKSNVLRAEDAESFLGGLKDDKFVKVSFKMVVDGIMDSEIMQLLSIDFSKQLVEQLVNKNSGRNQSASENSKANDKVSEPEIPSIQQPIQQMPSFTDGNIMQVNDTASQMPQFMPQNQGLPQNMQQQGMMQQNMQQGMQPNMQQGMQPNMMQGMQQQGMQPNMQAGMQPQGMGYDPNMGMYQQQFAQNPYGMPMQQGMPNGYMQAPSQNNVKQPVNIQPVNFQTFDEGKVYLDKKNVDIIMDVPLQVTVELGRTNKLIREILEFGAGTIVELDKLAGEPVDILVNGKMIAKGEVVVIDESFGVRITEIVQPSLRL